MFTLTGLRPSSHFFHIILLSLNFTHLFTLFHIIPPLFSPLSFVVFCQIVMSFWLQRSFSFASQVQLVSVILSCVMPGFQSVVSLFFAAFSPLFVITRLCSCFFHPCCLAVFYLSIYFRFRFLSFTFSSLSSKPFWVFFFLLFSPFYLSWPNKLWDLHLCPFWFPWQNYLSDLRLRSWGNWWLTNTSREVKFLANQVAKLITHIHVLQREITPGGLRHEPKPHCNNPTTLWWGPQLMPGIFVSMLCGVHPPTNRVCRRRD